MDVNDSLRLTYELMSEKDADLLFELDQDPKVLRYITGGRMTPREEIHSAYIPRMESYTNAERGWGLWKVSLRQSSKFAGWILVRPMAFFTEQRDDNDLELGWRFLRNTWGNGYATEAATAVMKALEANKVCEYFSAIADVDNSASINVMKKLGMKFVRQEEQTLPHGEVTVVFYQRKADSP